MIRQTIDNYFIAWNNHSTEQLGPLFSDDVVLEDWEITATGKEDVLDANRDIFDNVPQIVANVKSIIEDGNNVAAVLEIDVDGTEKFDVVDIFTLDDNNKIIKIKAFKG